MTDAEQIAEAAAGELLRAEREAARMRLLAGGLPAEVVQQLLAAAEAMHAGQLAALELQVSAAIGRPATIH